MHLLTDTAVFGNGQIVGFADNLALRSNARLVCAAMTGWFDLSHLCAKAIAGVASIDDVRPEQLQASFDGYPAPIIRTNSRVIAPAIRVFVAGWSERDGCAKLGVGRADRFFEDCRPATLLRWFPFDQKTLVRNGILPGFPSFDAWMLEVAKFQREQYLAKEHTLCVVGGSANLTTVTESGIEQNTLHVWPDKRGDRFPVPFVSSGRMVLWGQIEEVCTRPDKARGLRTEFVAGVATGEINQEEPAAHG